MQNNFSGYEARAAVMDYDNYDVSLLPKLSEEDEKKWYSGFYYRGRGEIAAEIAEKIAPGNPMDAKYAVLPGDCDRMMQPGNDENDFGYCLLENGIGYGSTRTELPGITMDMFRWYKSLCFDEAFMYAIWYPGSHVSELKGITIEDLGFGVEQLEPHSPANWKQVAFSKDPAEVDPRFILINGGNCKGHLVGNEETTPRAMMLFNYIRELPEGGIEFRTHFYIGAHVVNGEFIEKQDIDPELCLEMARRMASHSVYERENLNNFLPELYAHMASTDS